METWVEQFIEESNAIEDEFGVQAQEDSVEAWKYLAALDKVGIREVLQTHNTIMKRLWPEIGGLLRKVQIQVGSDTGFPNSGQIRRLLTTLLEWVPTDAIQCLGWHIEFERIHPFRDGNGRTGRLLYYWQMFSLGLTPMIFRVGDKDGYYSLFRGSRLGNVMKRYN